MNSFVEFFVLIELNLLVFVWRIWVGGAKIIRVDQGLSFKLDGANGGNLGRI